MKLFHNVKGSASGLAFVALVSVSSGFLEATPAFAKAPEQAQPAILTASAIAVADKYSADAAEQIFKEGGNAVDAAVAIAFTLAVTYPEAGNIGGGGFMTLYVDGKPYFLDYRERAPLAATKNMYLDDKGEVIKGMSVIGYRSVGVPGTVDGMWQAQRRFGKLKWKQVLAPAIHYARDGFEVSQQLQQRRDDAAKDFAGKTNFDTYFGNLKQGVNFKQADLAAVLQRISDQGAQDFYSGRTADLIAASMRGHGLITKDDLQQYKAVWREPVQANWNGYRVITAPPPSSGGVGLVQLLKMKADIAPEFKDVPPNSAQYVHLIAEIEKRVFADRAQYLGDPGFVKVPVGRLIDPAYSARRAAQIDPVHPSPTASVAPGLEKPQTTHFSIVDRWGNAVSNTYTLNGWFGSGVIVEGAGFALNDEMDDFSAKPNTPNSTGVVGGDANAIAPGKRPLSSMTPTILTRNGTVAMVIGTPGASRIFTSVFQVLADVYDFHMPLARAEKQFRFHHQLLPEDVVFSEPWAPCPPSLVKALEARGYAVQDQGWNGDIEAIQILGRTPAPSADPRGRGRALIIR